MYGPTAAMTNILVLLQTSTSLTPFQRILSYPSSLYPRSRDLTDISVCPCAFVKSLLTPTSAGQPLAEDATHLTSPDDVFINKEPKAKTTMSKTMPMLY
ncbi:uncharacterized [Tachysurus ichikawai]